MLQGERVDATAVVEYLKSTGNRFYSLSTDRKVKLSDLLFQMDNGRPHTAALKQDFLAETGVQPVTHSPYSPDLNVCDRYLFRVLKSDVKHRN